VPGPVSDSYDVEWGTSEKAEHIRDAVLRLHARLTRVLRDRPPVDIRELVDEEHIRGDACGVILTEWELRILRFACERARESI
jgi:hypothetical protein